MSRRQKRKADRVLVRGATVVTVDPQDRVLRSDVLIEDGKIVALEEKIPARGMDRVVEAKGLVAIPGFVQCHIHLCQMLFRAQADDMQLLDWLSTRIWPMEAALEPEDLRASARLGIAEVLLSGTTSVLDMGTVHHTEVLFEEAKRFGLRYTGGKCLMDQGHGFPAKLKDSTDAAVEESVELCERFHGKGLLRYAFAPRARASDTERRIASSLQESTKRGENA
ncbi:MAG: amidohydrolase family protein [Myxococcota bacterium]